MRGVHRIIRLSCLVAGLASLAGCNNDPYATHQPIPLQAEFQAFHLTDELQPSDGAIDSVIVWVAGTMPPAQVRAKVNGSSLTRIPLTSSTVGLFVASMPVTPNDVLKLDISTPWRTSHNEIIVPGDPLAFRSPISDTVYDRSLPIDVGWEGVSTGTVIAQLMQGSGASSTGEVLWSVTAPFDSAVQIPPSIWATRSDTTAMATLWRAHTASGDGFEGGLHMIAAIGIRRLVRVTRP